MIELPWPPSSLSGHAKGHWRTSAPIVAKHREWAKNATKAWMRTDNLSALDGGFDIRVSATFYPPDHRSDRVNYPNRMKPYWDGIAEALGVNDRRFLPSFNFAEPVKGAGKVVVIVG